MMCLEVARVKREQFCPIVYETLIAASYTAHEILIAASHIVHKTLICAPF